MYVDLCTIELYVWEMNAGSIPYLNKCSILFCIIRLLFCFIPGRAKYILFLIIIMLEVKFC